MNSIAWKQKGAKKRFFENKKEESDFFKGIVKIDLLHFSGRVLYSKKRKDNTISETEDAAVRENINLKEHGYDRPKTVNHNNKKFEKEIMSVMVIDNLLESGMDKVKWLEMLGHSTRLFQDLTSAQEEYAVSYADWDIIIVNDHIKDIKFIFENSRLSCCTSGKSCKDLLDKGYDITKGCPTFAKICRDKSKMTGIMFLTLKIFPLKSDQRAIVLAQNRDPEGFKRIQNLVKNRKNLVICDKSEYIIKDLIYKVS